MYDCAREVLGYHDDEVTLPQAERTTMRERRDANRTRAQNGLKKNNDPQPREFVPQGSYAMKTMIRHPEKDYDIDDGIYFEMEALKGRNGAYKTALQARQMVCDALRDERFKTAPEVRLNCVRVYYNEGYHVDVPVYRRVVTSSVVLGEQVHHELASADWKRSDARDVTKWFEGEMKACGGDGSRGRQMRRVVREIKKFAKSRGSWGRRIASGFCITKLVTECFKGDAAREDKALRDTMDAIHDRLLVNLEVDHPVTPNEKITSGPHDAKTKFLREKLGEAIDTLSVLFESDCTRKRALEAWDKVYGTTYFTERLDDRDGEATKGASLSSGLLKQWGAEAEPSAAIKKGGGGRFA